MSVTLGWFPYLMGCPAAEARKALADDHGWLSHGLLEVAHLSVGCLLHREDEEQPKARHDEFCGAKGGE